MANGLNGNSNGWTNWTLERAKPHMLKFCDKLRNSGNVRASCQAASIPRSTAYYWRNKFATFAAAWDEALEDACDALEGVAWNRAIEHSDRLLMFLLKAHRREVYGDVMRTELTGADGGAVALQYVGNVNPDDL